MIFYLFARIFPYLTTQVPLGYDAGLYLYLFKQYQGVPYLSFTKLTTWVVEMYPPIVPIVGKFLSTFIEPEKLLIPLVITFSVFLFVAAVKVARKLWDKQAAQWTGLFLAISALQFRAYWYYYAKQILASAVLLVVLAMFSSASWWAVPLSVLIVFTHQPTALVLGAAILSGWIVEKEKRRYYSVVGITVAVCATWYYLPSWEITVKPLLAPFLKSFVPPAVAGGMMYTPSGTFYDLLPALVLSLPYLPWAVVGFIRMWRTRKLATLTGATMAVVVTIGLGLFLWRRYLIYLDLLAIMWAGAGISAFSKKWGKAQWWKVMRVVYVGLLLLFGALFVARTSKPLIFDDELREIKMLNETEADAYVLVTDERYMPYIYGWSNRKPIAPGYGEYDLYWSIPEWHIFWESNDREKENELLMKLPKPLYIYHGDRSRLITPKFEGECFEQINWRTYKYNCEREE